MLINVNLTKLQVWVSFHWDS